MDRGLLEDIKSVLKSLIISCPHGMTIDQLNKDYRSMEGRAIPFSQLGYSKLETFLKSLTETLVVSGSGFDAKVFAVKSEKTAHIDNMVSKQKNATRSRRVPNRSSGNNYRPPPPQPSKPPLISHSPMHHQHNRISPLMQLPQSPQQRLQQHHLQQQHLQQQQLYRFNTVNQNVCFNNVMNHPLLVQQQINSFRNVQYPIQSPTFLTAFQQYQNIPLLNRLQNYNPKVNASNNNQLQQQQQQSHHNHHRPQQQHNYQKPTLQEPRKPNHSENPTNHTNGYRNVVSPISQTRTSDSKSSQLSDERTKVNSLAHRSMKPAEENYSDEEIIDFYDYDETIKTKNHLTKSNYDRKVEKSFMNSTNNSDGLTHASSNGNGYNNLVNVSDDRVNDITESFRTLDLNSNSEDRNYKMYEAIPELQQNDIVFQLDYPSNTVKYGEYIPKSEIPSSIAETNWFSIFITEIHNPYKFWFHFYKENHELDVLMRDIENVYTNLGAHELQMHTSGIKAGQVCCALYIGMWHRAEILEQPEKDKVKVCFVDYGTVTSVELIYVKYLLSDFSSLPSQAIRGSLAHIRPVKHRWSRDATYAFLDMVYDLLLFAKATDINYEERTIQMILTDTSSEVDFQINDALIHKGHARLYTSTASPSQSNSSESQIITPPRKHFQETYPTFDMLEKGEYPSFFEIGIYLNKGIDFEAIQDQNIIPDVDGGHSIDEITKKLTTPNTSRTEITKFNDSSKDFDVDDSGVCDYNNDESKFEEITVKSPRRNNVNSSLSLNLTNPFLNSQRSLNNRSDSPEPVRTVEENHLEKEKNPHEKSAFIETFKFGTLNPFISESDSDNTETTISSVSNQKEILNHNPNNSQTYYQQQPQLSVVTMPLLQPQPITQQIYTQFQPIVMQQQPQQIYQLPPSNQFNYPNLNMNNYQNLHLFNFNHQIPNLNSPAAAQSAAATLITNSILPIRPPPGFEHVNPRTRNIFQ